MTYLDVALEVFQSADSKTDPAQVRLLARLMSPDLLGEIPAGGEALWRRFFQELYREVGKLPRPGVRAMLGREFARN